MRLTNKEKEDIILLHIETATEICSVSLSKNTELLACKSIHDGNSHARNLIVLIESLISELALPKTAIDGISVSMGPGSYTGLRIGVSTAKGLCYALQRPLIAVSTLDSIAMGAKRQLSLEGEVKPPLLVEEMAIQVMGKDAVVKYLGNYEGEDVYRVLTGLRNVETGMPILIFYQKNQAKELCSSKCLSIIEELKNPIEKKIEEMEWLKYYLKKYKMSEEDRINSQQRIKELEKEISSVGAKRQLSLEEDVLYCPMIDARRMEVYTELVDAALQTVQPVQALVVEEGSFDALLSEKKVAFCGNGMPKCRSLLEKYPNALFADAEISAENMVGIAYQKFIKGEFEDVAYFEPFYLKQYIAKKSHVKGLE